MSTAAGAFDRSIGVSGEARFYAGDRLEQQIDATAGDVVYVPAHEVHVEQNRSRTRPLRMIVSRSPRDVVVEVQPPDGWTTAADSS